ncbi:MAG: type IV toxin-antitoxin system AbiEi family antitoxin domain-containing protein [Candidatus Aminicenantales bacterium]
MGKSKEQAVIDLAKELGTIRIKDLLDRGLHPEFARRLVSKEILNRSGRGLYTLADSEITEYHDFALVGKRLPKGVVCLTSALRFHGIGTQLPRKIWLALEKGSAQPRLSYPPISVIRLSGASFFEGIDEHTIEGVMVRIYNPAKTVADCFKFRNTLGLDVALEAGKDCIYSRKATISEIYDYAKVCRVANVIKPYFEAWQY